MALSITLITGTDESANLYGKNLNNEVLNAKFKVSLGSSYTTDGEDLTAAIVTAAIDGTCTTIRSIRFGGPSADGVHSAAWDPTNSKVLSFTATATQSASTTDLSAAAKDVYCSIDFV